MAKLLSACPVCGNTLVIKTLQCPSCSLELKNDFQLSVFDCLDAEQYGFLIAFLKCRGNLSALQDELGISYPSAKRKLDELLLTLGITEKGEALNMENWNANQASGKASDIIKAKLIQCSGHTNVYSLSGNRYEISIKDAEHFVSPQLPMISYHFFVFDIIVDHLILMGGRAKKGNARNAPLGGPGCEETTVSGAVLKNYFHKNVGETGLEPVHVLAAVLEWAGIAHNGRGYLELTAEYRQERSKIK